MRKPRRKSDDHETERRVADLVDGVVAAVQAERGGVPPSRVRPTLAEATREFQRKFIIDAFEECRTGGRWNLKATARTLGVARSVLYRLLERLDLPPRMMSDSQPRDARRVSRRGKRAAAAISNPDGDYTPNIDRREGG